MTYNDVAFADRLIEVPRSSTKTYALLAEIIDTHSGVKLEDHELDKIVNCLVNPVNFAVSKRYDQGIKYGIHSANQAVANRLGLGKLESPGE